VASEPFIRDLLRRESRGVLDYFGRRAARDEAEDLLGETLLVVWRRAATIPDDETRARMWMYGVARKVLAGHRRSLGRRAALTDKLREQIVVTPASTDDATDEVRGRIAALPEIDREILMLVYWDGFSLVEAAAILGMRDTSVRTRHARAKASLRASLADQGMPTPRRAPTSRVRRVAPDS